MYDRRNNFVLGFHGCDESVRDLLLTQPGSIKQSQKPYDWLGHGMYFWENNLARAEAWAKEKEKRGEIKKASVLGAILSLDFCLDLIDSKYTRLLAQYYQTMKVYYKDIVRVLPQNKDLKNDNHKDKILRESDCAVIEFMHKEIRKAITSDSGALQEIGVQPFDSVRGLFTEGGPAFPGAGVTLKNHIQICIRNQNCIKGFFKPRRQIRFNG